MILSFIAMIGRYTLFTLQINSQPGMYASTYSIGHHGVLLDDFACLFSVAEPAFSDIHIINIDK